MRDEFSEKAKITVAQRVGYFCSNPRCRVATSGPQTDPSKALNLGVAAHITAASEGGPRYDSELNSDQRSHATNAIWLCQNCAKLIDNDAIRFSAALLRGWKHEAENNSYSQIGKATARASRYSEELSGEEVDLLIAAAERGDISVLADEQTGKWVRAGGSDYSDPADPAYARTYVDALRSLCRRRLAEHDAGVLYVLTSNGFRIARALRDAAG